MSKTVTRLYEQFHPEEYWVSIVLNKVDMTFTGSVKIAGKKVGRPSKRINLHQKELTIESATIVKLDKTDKTIELQRINTHKSYDEVRLHTKELLYPGDYRVELNFSGLITKSMHGIYPCFFKDDGQEKTLIATQFESHHAREAFPCIDEPEAKAVFNLEVATPQNEIVISNTEEKSSKVVKGMRHTVFEPTPIMSSYLLAF